MIFNINIITINFLFIIINQFYINSNSQVAPNLDIGVLPSLFVHGDHYSIGQQIGYATKDSIKYRLEHYPNVLEAVAWTLNDPQGAAAYNDMLYTANSTFPEYIQEIEGMAYGSGIDFHTLFVLNVRNELISFQDNGDINNKYQEVEHCSDYLMNQLDATGDDKQHEIIIGHNEDGESCDRDISLLVTVHIEGDHVREAIRFTAFTYAGDLATAAFFWNEYGLCVTMNGLYPVKNLYGGLGRNFISRNVLGSKSIDEAIKRITIPNQATGHSYNIASIHEQRLLNIETGPGIDNIEKATIYTITEIQQSNSNTTTTYSSLFHANAYKFAPVEDQPSPSSVHRMERAAELPPPMSKKDIRMVLGDTKDTEWPIYRTGMPSENDDVDSGYTLITVMFSIIFNHDNNETLFINNNKESSTVTLYLSNPKKNEDINITMPIIV